MILEKNNFNILKNISITSKYLSIFIVLLVVQIVFWSKYVSIKAELEVVSTPPNEKTMEAFSFGDKEYYFRLKSFQVQNMGDTFGRFTSLKKYDYKKLYAWFIELEKLNYNSNYLLSLMDYYFSLTTIPFSKKKIKLPSSAHKASTQRWITAPHKTIFHKQNHAQLKIKIGSIT